MALFCSQSLLLRLRHSLPIDEVRGRLDRALRSVEQRHNLRWHWQEHTLEVLAPDGIAKGASGRIAVQEQAVQVELRIPLAFLPARGKIAHRVEYELGLLLSAEAAA